MNAFSYTKFIHLRCRTEYSIRDGLLRIKPWLQRVKQLQMPAIAITDHCNLFGLVKFYRQALMQGIKPIMGADLKIKIDSEYFIFTLLCQNPTGYKNLLQLLSLAYLQGQNSDHEPCLQWDWLVTHHQGLLVLSGGRQGDVGHALLNGQSDLASLRLQRWLSVFPQRFYLELQRTGRPQEELYISEAVRLSSQHQVPVVATNEVCFLEKEDFIAHEARVCINAGNILADNRRPRLYSEHQYLRSCEEMTELFADIPEALTNTVAIAIRCTAPLVLGEVHLPKFPLPDDTLSLADYFAKQAQQGLQDRVASGAISNQQPAAYEQRLQQELMVINRMGFAGYFLIVADFIRWAKQQDIPVGRAEVQARVRWWLMR